MIFFFIALFSIIFILVVERLVRTMVLLQSRSAERGNERWCRKH